MSCRTLTAPCLLLLAVWLGAPAAGRAPLASLPAVSFVGLPAGWQSFRDDGAVATSWGYRPGRSTGGWADHMPPGGIAVSVFFPSVTTPFRPLKLTLPARPATFLEGTTDTPEYRIQGRVGGRDVYVWVDVRRERPSALDLRIAQRVVSSIRFGGGAGRSTVFHGPGITLRTPSGWWANNKPLTAITNPVQRFVLSSYRIPVGADAGESYVPSPRGVLAELTEDVPAGGSARGWPPRPRQFVLPRLGRMETLNGDRWGEVLFREHGRHFYLFIWVGRDASPAQVAVLLRALAGMTIRRS